MNKLFPILIILLALGLGLIGCGLTEPEDDDKVAVSVSPIPEITSVSNQPIEGDISGNVEITDITYTVLNSARTEDKTITVSRNNVPPGKKKLDLKDDLAVVLKVTEQTCNGTYELQITVTAGSATSTKPVSFTVSGAKDCSGPVGTAVVTATINAGSNGNTALGSSIDLDAGIAYKSNDAASKVADIDLCYSFSDKVNQDKLGSPYWAQLSGYGYAALWADPPQTKFYKTALTKDTFDAITTKEQIPPFDAAKATASSYVVAANEVYQVQTTAGANVLILINAKVDGKAGSITMKTAK